MTGALTVNVVDNYKPVDCNSKSELIKHCILIVKLSPCNGIDLFFVSNIFMITMIKMFMFFYPKTSLTLTNIDK